MTMPWSWDMHPPVGHGVASEGSTGRNGHVEAPASRNRVLHTHLLNGGIGECPLDVPACQRLSPSVGSTITVRDLIASLESDSGRRQLHVRILETLQNPLMPAIEARDLVAAVGTKVVHLARELIMLERSGLVIHGVEDGVDRYALSLRGERLMRSITRVHAAKAGAA